MQKLLNLWGFVLLFPLGLHAADLVWSGTNGNNWDDSTVNWSNQGTPVKFHTNDNVTFNDTASNGNVVLNLVQPGSITVNNNTTAYTLSGSFNETEADGGVPLLKSGTGTLTINASDELVLNDTVISAGTMITSNTSNSDVFDQSGGNVTLGDVNTGTNNTALLFTTGNLTIHYLTSITVSSLGSGTVTIGRTNANGNGAIRIGSLFTLNRDTTFQSGTSGQLMIAGYFSGNGNATFTGGGVTQFTTFTNGGTSAPWTGNIFVTGNSVVQTSGTGLAGTRNLDIAAGSGVSFATHGANSITFGMLTGGGYIGSGSTTSGTLVVGGTNASSTFNGVIGGATIAGSSIGFALDVTKVGSGTFTLTGSNTYTGITKVSQGKLTVNGSIASSSQVVIGAGATLGGSGFVSKISGTGGNVAPGGSQILTATQVDASGGMSFNFQISGTSPIYNNASASGNDVLHLTGPTPLLSPLTSANTITVDFSAITGSLALGQIYYGGFFLDTATTLGTPTFVYTGVGSNRMQFEGFAIVPSAVFTSGTVTNGRVMEFEIAVAPSAPGPVTPVSHTTTVSAGVNYNTVTPVTAAGGYGSTATIVGGTASTSSNVTVAFNGTGNFKNIASDVATVSGMPDKGSGPLGSTLTDKFVLELSIDATAASALGGVSDMALLWNSPVGGWVNAVLGNSDAGAGANFVLGAYDPSLDNNLSWYGVDTADGYVWAVLDHNSDFGAGNPSNTPFQDVPEPSTWAMLAMGATGLFFGVRRRVKV